MSKDWVLAAARAFIAQVRWQEAVTMPDWPHAYTVKTWRTDLAQDFEAVCSLIAEQGQVEPWPPSPATPIYHNHYLTIDGFTYWAMGPQGDRDRPEQKTVINRTPIAAGTGGAG